MVVSIWRTGVDRSRLEEYIRFEEECSLPMFCEQPGLIGVFFMREGEDCAGKMFREADRDRIRAACSTVHTGTGA